MILFYIMIIKWKSFPVSTVLLFRWINVAPPIKTVRPRSSWFFLLDRRKSKTCCRFHSTQYGEWRFNKKLLPQPFWWKRRTLVLHYIKIRTMGLLSPQMCRLVTGRTVPPKWSPLTGFSATLQQNHNNGVILSQNVQVSNLAYWRTVPPKWGTFYWVQCNTTAKSQ